MNWIKYIGIFILFVAVAYAGMILLAPSEVSVQVNEDINAPIDQVFDASTDYTQFSKWINGVKSAKKVRGEVATVGAEYKVYFEGDMNLNHKVTFIEENKQYAYSGVVQDFFQITSKTSFEAVDSNTTRVMTKLTMKPLSTKMKMFMYFEETHKKNAAANLASMKEFLER